jgi:lipid II:glycine glycyltransferase (peptidoglycan interpeptide bridge formation enzyme)
VLWETIRVCAAKGMRTLSLGRTDLDNEGLLTFKNGWGAQRSELNYYRYEFASSAFVCDRERNLGIFRKVLRTLPVAVLQLIGRLAYKHIG